MSSEGTLSSHSTSSSCLTAVFTDESKCTEFNKRAVCSNVCFSFYREQLFKTHPHIEQLSNAVISAFVSIEVTGQAHFEDKFKYRQPMYQALEYMWGVDTHCNAIKVGTQFVVLVHKVVL